MSPKSGNRFWDKDARKLKACFVNMINATRFSSLNQEFPTGNWFSKANRMADRIAAAGTVTTQAAAIVSA